MLYIKLMGITKCSIMVANILSADGALVIGSKGQKSTFSEHGHVAYQINAITKCNKMVANIMPADPLSPMIQGDGVNRSKSNFFRTWSCCISY